MAILTKMDSQKTSNLNLESCPETTDVILNLFQDQNLRTSESRFYVQGKWSVIKMWDAFLVPTAGKPPFKSCEGAE